MQPSPRMPSMLRTALIGGVAVLVVALVALLAPQTAPLAVVPSSPYGFPFGQTLNLQIGPKKMQELERRRAEALAVGILRDDDSSWVKAKWIEGIQTWPVKVRLKGDWTDHLEGEKWSFRVQMKDSAAWRGMRVFSLQSPDRRGFLNEWLFHQVLAREGLLTPRYDFIRLQLNGKALGTYAVEEHCSKELLESQGRREGPILKIDESGMWDARIASLADSAFPYLETPFFDAAPVLPFQRKHILQDSILHAQFDQAQRLLMQYRAGVSTPAPRKGAAFVTDDTPIFRLSQVFDVTLAAKQYALTDLFAAYHSLIWHNRRFYFNPITERLEPVVFDGFDGPENDTYIPYPFWGYQLHGKSREDAAYRDAITVNVFQDTAFVRAYYRCLERYCQPAFLDSVFAELKPAIDQRTAFLRSEYLGYGFSRRVLVENAVQIRGLLEDGLRADHFFVAHDQGYSCRGKCIKVRNHNPLPVEFWAERPWGLMGPELLDANCGQAGQQEVIWDMQDRERLFYRIPGTRELRVLDWRSRGLE